MDSAAAASPSSKVDVEAKAIRSLFVEPADEVATVSVRDDRIQLLANESKPAPAEPADPLTLQQVQKLALENHPALKQSIAVVNKTRGIYRQVGQSPNPVVGYSAAEIGSDGAAGQQGIFVSQTIVRGDKLSWNRTVAGHAVQAATWDWESRKMRVVTDVTLQFYETLGAGERLSQANKLVKIAEDGIKNAVKLLKAEVKGTTRPDVLQARIQLGQVRIILANAKIDDETERKKLAALIGRSEISAEDITGKLFDPARDFEWDLTYREILLRSPEIQAANTRVSRAQAAIERQNVQTIPNLQTQLGLAYDFSSGDSIVNVQLGIALPLSNRNRGNIDAATAEAHRAMHNVERLQLALRLRLMSAFAEYRRSKKQTELYSTEIKSKVEENLKLTIEGNQKQLEAFNSFRVLVARRLNAQIQLARINSFVALRKAEARIAGLLLTGGLDAVNDVDGNVGGLRGQALSGQ